MKKSYLFLMMALIVAVVTACGGTSKDSSSTDGSNKALNSQEPSTEPTVEPTVEPTPEPTPEPETTYAPGEKFTFGDWEVNLESFAFDQKVTDKYMSSSADEGNKFLVLNFALTNNGTSAAQFKSMFDGVSIKAIFKDNYEYNTSMTMIDGDLSNESVKPLSTKKGFIVVEVPDSVAEAGDSLVLQLSLDKEEAKITLR
ncbi:DUF4352 domain-containing protein [Paenibacillus paeoniae]|uniref:DUF4352 domain-containing protein n=1 Tax=Paenibacillus paeoniae TaxID=2292705 RepID=A0A371PFJ2_9BACL|nr:DUF4352 domain-containing protein [Paenibacillus paeoniae]REK74170.1 DUF4352 domain-containing protein [Paenibacillus paeoniae]